MGARVVNLEPIFSFLWILSKFINSFWSYYLMDKRQLVYYPMSDTFLLTNSVCCLINILSS